MSYKLTSISKFVAAALLFIAVIHLPIGFYTFLRISVTCIGIYNAYESRNSDQKLWLMLFICAAIIFNPLIPIYLKNKNAWSLIDIIFGIIFLASAFFSKDKT